MSISETVSTVWNMACPYCGWDGKIDIAATVWVRLCPDGTDVEQAATGDHEWGHDDDAVCHNCGYTGEVQDFRIGDIKPVNNRHMYPRAMYFLLGVIAGVFAFCAVFTIAIWLARG